MVEIRPLESIQFDPENEEIRICKSRIEIPKAIPLPRCFLLPFRSENFHPSRTNSTSSRRRRKACATSSWRPTWPRARWPCPTSARWSTWGWTNSRWGRMAMKVRSFWGIREIWWGWDFPGMGESIRFEGWQGISRGFLEDFYGISLMGMGMVESFISRDSNHLTMDDFMGDDETGLWGWRNQQDSIPLSNHQSPESWGNHLKTPEIIWNHLKQWEIIAYTCMITTIYEQTREMYTDLEVSQNAATPIFVWFISL